MMKKNKKGQLEFVIIIAVIIIGILVALFIVQQLAIKPPPSSGISEEIKTIKDSINEFMEDELRETLIEIYNQGGYQNLVGVESTEFDTLDIPIWHACSDVHIPDVKEQIDMGMRELEVIKKGVRHVKIIVLSSMNQKIVNP